MTQNTPPDDIRWQQRLSNYTSALAQLDEAVALRARRPLSNLAQQGLIKAFEFTQEFGWKVMKDYFIYQGNPNITGSRDAIREAFKQGLILDGDGWMDTIRSRNLAAHTYDEARANEIAQSIAERYLGLFQAFDARMQALMAGEHD
ncbi:MAG: nucleotidyltransferase [Chromatiaceae bacterium]|nr:MAG: nucleotidyltransferase [Chromatiaceae bacterium]